MITIRIDEIPQSNNKYIIVRLKWLRLLLGITLKINGEEILTTTVAK